MCQVNLQHYLQEDGYHGFRRGSALGDINNDGLLDFGYSMWKNPDELSYLGIIFGSIPLDTLPDLIISTPLKATMIQGFRFFRRRSTALICASVLLLSACD